MPALTWTNGLPFYIGIFRCYGKTKGGGMKCNGCSSICQGIYGNKGKGSTESIMVIQKGEGVCSTSIYHIAFSAHLRKEQHIIF